MTLATAESCTGGLIGYLLTETSGSSAYYVGGLISYSNELKERELGVDARTLEKHGAVSAQTCRGHGRGRTPTICGDCRASRSPESQGRTGGTDQKPVGLTYVAVADEGGHDVRRNVWGDDRHGNKRA